MVSNLSKYLKIICSLVILFAVAVIPFEGASISAAQSDEEPQIASTSPATDTGNFSNPNLVRSFVDEEGRVIDEVIVPGRPPEIKAAVATVPESNPAMGISTLSNVPAFDWSYGCSATSAAMMMGYYDNTGYPNMYTGPTNSGVCPMDNSVWGQTWWIDEWYSECPLSATHQGVDGRTTKGHVDDYWVDYLSAAPDPFIGNWPEHTYGDCTGDFMGTNQYNFDNVDGNTGFYFDRSGAPLYDYTECEPARRDGCHGLKLFVESRGYTLVTNFSQYIYGRAPLNQYNGFTFSDFCSEIDAGRPVLIQLEDHTMLGYGYNTVGQIVYVHDTWDHSAHQMTWGGTYGADNLQHYGVIVIQLQLGGEPDITVSPTSFNVTLPADIIQNYTLTIGNDGDAPLTYSISDEETTGPAGLAGSEPRLLASAQLEDHVIELSPSQPVSFPAPAAADGEYELKYDDGWSEGYHSVTPHAEFAVRFTPPEYPVSLRTARFSLNPPTDFNSDLYVEVYDDDGPGGAPGTCLGNISTSGPHYSMWWDQDISSLGITISSGDFYVAYYDYSHHLSWPWDDCYGMNFDSSEPDGRSWYVSTSGEWTPYSYDYMIRCVVNAGGVNKPPNTPSNPSPLNHATGVSVNADLSWTGGDPDAGDTVTYDVYFDITGATTLVSNDQSATTYDPGTLNPNTQYYWKIVATDNHAASISGLVWDFTTGGVAGDCPWLDENPKSGSMPAGGSNDITVTINTTGLAVGNIYTAEIVIANNDPDENPKVVPVILHIGPNTPPILSNGYVDPTSGTTSTNFYYYISYYDADGDSPSTKDVYVDGSAYTMSLYSGTASNGVYRYGPKALIAVNHNYYFYFEDGKGGTSRLPISGSYSGPTISEFNNPPNMPSNPSPANHATNVSINACLSWTGGDPDAGDTVTYDVYFGTNATPPLVSNDQSGTTYDPGTLAYNTTYYWQVVATDSHGASTTGPLWDFTTGVSCQDEPSPAEGFASIADELVIVYYYKQNGNWGVYWPDFADTIGRLQVTKVYIIYIDDDCTLSYGTQTYALTGPDWNYMAWLGC